MSIAKLGLAGARHYWRQHVVTAIGCAVSALIIAAALVVGDSAAASLERAERARIGKVEFVALSSERPFRADLADRVAAAGAVDAAAVYLLQGTASTPDGSARLNQAQVLGVDADFWDFAPGEIAPTDALRELSAAESGGFSLDVAVSEATAERMGLAFGDTLILRLRKPSALSGDAPLSGETDNLVSIRCKVAVVVSPQHFSEFSLVNQPGGPTNIFLPRAVLAERIEQPGRANLIVARDTEASGGSAGDGSSAKAGFAAFAGTVNAAVDANDLGLSLERLGDGEEAGSGDGNTGVDGGGQFQLLSERVFLDPLVEGHALSTAPDGFPALTYFVNRIARAGDFEGGTPYSMATAVDGAEVAFLPDDLADDQAVITQWLADDLGVGVGDRLDINYFVMGPRRQLIEETASVTVAEIIPMDIPGLNTSWMPNFPGIADSENCRDWEPGMPVDLNRIRAIDEGYWDAYKGTPKLFLPLALGRDLWENRWGAATAVRTSDSGLLSALDDTLVPEQLGFSIRHLARQSDQSLNAPIDFGQLFIAFGFFVVAAGLALSAMLFALSIDARARETGFLRAVGLQPRTLFQLYFVEAVAIVIVGTVVGVLLGPPFARLLLYLLAGPWSGAAAGIAIGYHPTAGSMIGAGIMNVVITLLAVGWTIRRRVRGAVAGQVSGVGPVERASGNGRATLAVLVLSVAVMVLALLGVVSSGSPTALFFLIAFVVAGAGFGVFRVLAERIAGKATAVSSVGALAVSMAFRRFWRSLTLVGILASGFFVVVSVGLFRKAEVLPGADRDSGTGGFAWVAESSVPIFEDLNTPGAQREYGLPENALAGVSFVQARVLPGDDASCLSLRRAVTPQVLGVVPGELAEREAFTFAGSDRDTTGWAVLDERYPDGAIPAVVDQNSMLWALQKTLGATLEYRGEGAQPVRIRLAAAVSGSMLQGKLLINEAHFIEAFPQVGGYRFFLIDAPFEEDGSPVSDVAATLNRALGDFGFAVEPTWRRLAAYNAVENAYISIFQSLGAVGLVLATGGFGVILARNVLERRGELAVLWATGFTRRGLIGLLFREHALLAAAGLFLGGAAGSVAVGATAASGLELTSGPGIAVFALLVLLLLLVTIGLVAAAALRQNPLQNLRSE